jgi:hypothetical protein
VSAIFSQWTKRHPALRNGEIRSSECSILGTRYQVSFMLHTIQ